MNFIEMYNRQVQNQVSVYREDPANMEAEDVTVFVNWNVLAAHAELTELLDQHPGWKPWSKSYGKERPAKEKVAGEVADIMCFIFNVARAAGLEAHELAGAFMEKVERNAARQHAGYDSSSSEWKCPACGQALDDPGVTCTSDGCADVQPGLF